MKGLVRTRVKKRIIFLFFVVLLLTLMLSLRLAWLQIVRSDELQSKALDQRMQPLPVEPSRGTIYDRRGKKLAVSAEVESIFAIPVEIEDPDQVAETLSTILDMPAQEIYQRITRRQAFSWVERKISEEEALKIRNLQIPGIDFTEESKRFYPKDNLASHVLGFAGIDNQGLEGVELFYDEYLRGTPGQITAERDASGREIPKGLHTYIPPEEGRDLYLTIDEVIQYIVERELDKAYEEHNPKKINVIIMNPQNGEILAIANRPDYDPNRFADFKSEYWRNSAISDSYEPGSTFKMITGSTALEEGLADLNDTFFDPGFKNVSGQRIHCHLRSGHGSLDFVGIFKNSCNVGFMDVGERLGVELFHRYIRGFEFGKETGIDLPGEATGIVMREDDIGPVELATMSFGQGVAVTPLQLIRATSAFANGGWLVTPHVGLREDDGKKINPSSQSKRRVMSSDTAETMRYILRQVVADGSGFNAQMPGYGVAGKTGTAEIYGTDRYIGSFIGFLPRDTPELIGLVVVHEPEGIFYGGLVAAPIFKAIMEDVVRYLEIKPDPELLDEEEEPNYVKVPHVSNRPLEDAKRLLLDSGLNYRIEGEGRVVVEQRPPVGTRVEQGTAVLLYTADQASTLEQFRVPVPDLKGKTLQEVRKVLSSASLEVDHWGQGVVREQNPAPGERVDPGSTIEVRLGN